MECIYLLDQFYYLYIHKSCSEAGIQSIYQIHIWLQHFSFVLLCVHFIKYIAAQNQARIFKDWDCAEYFMFSKTSFLIFSIQTTDILYLL